MLVSSHTKVYDFHIDLRFKDLFQNKILLPLKWSVVQQIIQTVLQFMYLYPYKKQNKI